MIITYIQYLLSQTHLKQTIVALNIFINASLTTPSITYWAVKNISRVDHLSLIDELSIMSGSLSVDTPNEPYEFGSYKIIGSDCKCTVFIA